MSSLGGSMCRKYVILYRKSSGFLCMPRDEYSGLDGTRPSVQGTAEDGNAARRQVAQLNRADRRPDAEGSRSEPSVDDFAPESEETKVRDCLRCEDVSELPRFSPICPKCSKSLSRITDPVAYGSPIDQGEE